MCRSRDVSENFAYSYPTLSVMEIRKVEELLLLKESEDRVEFKEARKGMTYAPHDGSDNFRCLLAYVVAFANIGGGDLVLGVSDEYPHRVVGTTAFLRQMGETEAKIYSDIGIRTEISEQFYEDKRIVLVHIPARPVGKVYRLKGVPLTRIGEQIRVMDDVERKRIENEIEDDFSSHLCAGARFECLNPQAIDILKSQYRLANPGSRLPDNEDQDILSDLGLINRGKLTYAALILLGTAQAIAEFLPHSIIRIEYRQQDADIKFTKRVDYCEGFYISLGKIWDAINSINRYSYVLNGPYSTPIPFFNEGVIREAICNAVAHRDYHIKAETIIKISNDSFSIQNVGGFPLGVNLDNIISIPSTPRNRLLADVLNKTGLVERSGQGVDRIFLDTLTEGKGMPDYSDSTDDFVNLRIQAPIEDAAFVRFINEQNEILERKLSVADIINLHKVLHDRSKDIPYDKIRSLLSRKLIVSVGKTRAVKYELSKSYYEYAGISSTGSQNFLGDNPELFYELLVAYFKQRGKAKMRDIVDALGNFLSVKQIRTRVQKLCEAGKLISSGNNSATVYSLPHQVPRKKENSPKNTSD